MEDVEEGGGGGDKKGNTLEGRDSRDRTNPHGNCDSSWLQ